MMSLMIYVTCENAIDLSQKNLHHLGSSIFPPDHVTDSAFSNYPRDMVRSPYFLDSIWVALPKYSSAASPSVSDRVGCG